MPVLTNDAFLLPVVCNEGHVHAATHLHHVALTLNNKTHSLKQGYHPSQLLSALKVTVTSFK